MAPKNTRLLIVVENADYRESLADIFLPEMLQEGLRNQVSSSDLHILSAAAHWSEHLQAVAIFSCYSDKAYSEVSHLGIRLMGSGLSRKDSELFGDKAWVKLVADFCPTQIVLCTPIYAILNWATRNHIPSVALLSDWQGPLGWRQRWQHNRLIKQLCHPSVEWVGNHGAHACKILEASGIEASKLIPWEWPQPQSLQQYILPKQIRPERGEIDLLYSGSLMPRTGVSDLLMAVHHIKKRGNNRIHLQIIIDQDQVGTVQVMSAHGQTNAHQDYDAQKALSCLKAQIQQLDIDECVSFSSAVSKEQTIERMRNVDLVVIPGCPQKFPMEPPPSLYRAMAARTPIIATDQPHFKKHLAHGVNAMIFPIGNDKSMAHRIERVMGQPQLYAHLSEASEVALNTLKVPACWSELIERWLAAGPENNQWLCNYAFSSGRYQSLSDAEKPTKALSYSA